MSTRDDALVEDLAATVDGFAAGDRSFDELQAKLQTVMSLLERRPGLLGLAGAVRSAEADLEEIRFLVSDDEQSAAASPVLESLRSAIAGAEVPE